jgi:tetratricopeptide (TPR) repeat protein
MDFQNEKLISIAESFMNDPEEATLGQAMIDRKLYDFSLESLEHLEQFLINVQGKPASEREWAGLALRCGAYTGEVIRRNSKSGRYNWLDYSDAAQIDSSLTKLGKSLGTFFSLYNAPNTFWFPIARIEKFLNGGSEYGLLAFAEVAIQQVGKASPSEQADMIYQSIEQRWAEIVDLSLYDVDSILEHNIAQLELALSKDQKHLLSLSLLSELLIVQENYSKAQVVIKQLIQLEPTNALHQTKHDLLSNLNINDQNAKIEVEWWIKDKWREVNGW